MSEQAVSPASSLNVGDRVRLSAAGIARLGPTRKRIPTTGTVTAITVVPKRQSMVKATIAWDRPAGFVEDLGLGLIERVS